MPRFVSVKPLPRAAQRTRNKLALGNQHDHEVELLEQKHNYSLHGDGFLGGARIMYLRFWKVEGTLKRTVWEGWIPEDDVEWCDLPDK